MKTALLIIDIQNDYFPGGKMELEGSIEAAAAAARLLAAFRKQSWSVFLCWRRYSADLRYDEPYVR